MTILHAQQSSEPRVLVLGGNPKPWRARDNPSNAASVSGIEAWAYAFNGDYIQGKTAKSRDIAGYDIVFGNTNLDSLGILLSLAESRPAGQKWVILIEGSAADYLYPRADIVRLFNAGDLVNVINKYSVDLYRAMTTTKVEYIGIPYPADEIRKLGTPIEQRKREVFLCPFLSSRWSEVFVARRLSFPYYGLERRLSRRLKTITSSWKRYRSIDPHYLYRRARELYEEPGLDIRQERVLKDHMRINGQAYLWLNFDERYTWGRHVLDAAAMQVPIIATRSTGHAEDFFPDLMLENPFELEKAYQYATRLIEDRDFYEAMCTIPIERFTHLLPQTMKATLLQALH